MVWRILRRFLLEICKLYLISATLFPRCVLFWLELCAVSHDQILFCDFSRYLLLYFLKSIDLMLFRTLCLPYHVINDPVTVQDDEYHLLLFFRSWQSVRLNGSCVKKISSLWDKAGPYQPCTRLCVSSRRETTPPLTSRSSQFTKQAGFISVCLTRSLDLVQKKSDWLK